MNLKRRLNALPFSRQVFWVTLVSLALLVAFVEVLGDQVLEPLFTSVFSAPPDTAETILWGFGILLPALLCSRLLSRFVERRLDNLATTGARLAAGDLTARIAPPDNNEDAFGKMTTEFNAMAQKLEDLFAAERRLLADISHELRSPLTRLGMALALAERDADDRVRRRLEVMESEVERMNELVAVLLQQGRLSLQSMEKTSVDLSDLLRTVAADAAFEGRATGKIVGGDIEDGLVVQGAAMSLRSLFANMADNALRYTPEGSSVEIHGRRDNGCILVEVRDHGPGVPEDMLEDIFRAFFRVDDSRDRQTGGVGLGLALARQAALAHGGEISAQNVAPGLLIRVVLPARRQE